MAAWQSVCDIVGVRTMAQLPAARLDGKCRPACTDTPPVPAWRRPRIIATIGPGTPLLDEIDMIRLDAAFGTMGELGRLRDDYDCPAILDIPGVDTRSRTSVLTTSELLVFAAAEAFDWVSLRSVTGAMEVERARNFLGGRCRLAASIARPEVLEASLPAICHAADALIVNHGQLAAKVGLRDARCYIQQAIVEAMRHGKPCLIASGLLPSMIDSVMPEIFELEHLGGLTRDGCAGFILCEETASGLHPQICVETLQIVMGPWIATARPRPRGAQLAGLPRILGTDNPGQ